MSPSSDCSATSGPSAPSSAESCEIARFLQAHLKQLCLRIGERHLGSPGEAAAQAWLEAAFQSYGYCVVREPFEAPGWRYGRHRLATQEGEEIEAFPCYFSPGGEVRATLKLLQGGEQGSQSGLERFRGCVVLAGNHDFANVGDTNSLAERLEAAGAAAFVINSPYNDTVSTKIIRSPALQRMPVFTLNQRNALRLAREEGQLVSVSLEAERFDHQSCNVIARYRPEGESRGKVVIGGHYDTAPGIQGAADNASGVALLLWLARLLRPRLPEWGMEVDFIAFGGEEYGGPGYGIGGFAYMQAHAAEAEAGAIRAMLCLDGIGTWLGEPEARVGRSRRLRRLIAEETTGSGMKVTPFRRGSDQGIFDLHGIPTAWFCEGGASNGVRHFPLHSPQDALEIINTARLAQIAGEIGRIAIRLLDEGIAEEPCAFEIAPLRQEERPEVFALVREVWTMGLSAQRERQYSRVIDAPWQEKIAQSVAEYLETPGVEAFAAKLDGIFAGFLSFRIDAPNSFGEIGYNAVAPRFGGRQLGRHLLDAALAELRRSGVRHVEVVTGLDPGHAPARATYESAGFLPMQGSMRYTLTL